MHIVIIGLGEVGRHLLGTLEREGHDIVAIDQSEAVVRSVEEHHDVMTIVGFGGSEKVLVEADVSRADLVASVTDNDEVNLIAAIASKQLGARRAVARAKGDQWAETKSGIRHGMFGIDLVINPRVLVAEELVKIARSRGAIDVIDVAEDRVELVELELSEKADHLEKPIATIPLPKDTLVAAVIRDDELFVPGGSDILRSGDSIYLIGRPEQLLRAEVLFTKEREANRVWIAGGGVVGEAIARGLLAAEVEVTIVELNRDRAQSLSGRLSGATVLHGDCTDGRLMVEEEVASYDLFVAVTADDELNLMAALLAKRQGVARTAAVVHRPDYLSIYHTLGVDVVLSPRITASDQILRYCRRAQLQSLSVLHDGQGEVLEILAQLDCAAVGVPLSQLEVPKGALFGAIVRHGQVVIPRGDSVISAGDTVVVLSTREARMEVERMFGARRS